VKALRARGRLEQERAILGYPARAAAAACASGQRERHALALLGVQPLPFIAQRRESVPAERLQHAVELDQHASEQPVAVGCGPRCGLEVGRRLPDPGARCVRQAHVDADADYHRGRPQRVALQFGEDPRELAPAPEHVIGPLECDSVRPGRLERAGKRHADRKRESRERGRAARGAPQQREGERLAHARVPGTAEPAAARRLPFRRDHRAAGRPPCCAFGERGICGVDRSANVERKAPGARAEAALDGGAIEQRDRVRQAVAAALHLVDFDARRLQVADRVPHARARHFEAARQRLAGVEAAVGEPREHACCQGFHGTGIE
jgi:hypothetical protein